MKKTLLYALGIMLLAACSDNDDSITDVPPTDNNKPEWYYAGGELGTAYLTTANAFEQPAPAVEDAGMMQSFLNGEALFEKQFMSNNSGTRHGLGPVYIRTSCMHCHPGYGHGQRIPEGSFSTKDPGNGCLLVVYNPETNAYVNWLAGMPQSHAVAPFKAPVDESKIQVKWLNAKDGWDNTFPDGETYELQYPEVTMPKEAIYVYNQGFDGLGNYEVRLESTIGIYGTGLLDAIDEKDIVAEWVKQEKDGYMRNGLNTAFFENGQWKSFYKNTAQGNGKEYVRRFTYAMSRGPLLDGAGANAIWNITNVTRSDRRYHYLDAAGTYAEYSAKDKEVQEGFEEYIAKVDPNKEHPSWWDGDMESRIKNYLTAKDLKVEMSDQEYIDLLIWHRGLAVPAVRDINNPAVQRGKEVFAQIGCDYCHRPSWTTGDDMVEDPALFKSGMAALEMPRYPQQKIWPYTDMVQHKLHMANDIRTGWCRTTPLWGRGLHQKCTGSATADRLHAGRARTALEAIMWHGYSEQSDAYECIKKFRELPKDDRDAVCAFVDAI